MEVETVEKGKLVENVALKLLKQAVIYLPEDVKKALQKAYLEEMSETGKTQLKAISLDLSIFSLINY